MFCLTFVLTPPGLCLCSVHVSLEKEGCKRKISGKDQQKLNKHREGEYDENPGKRQ